MEVSVLSADEWTKKMWDTETHTNTIEHYSAIKNENLPFTTARMDLKGITLSEISQRKTNILWSYLHVEPKQANKNECIDISPRVVQHGYYR